MIWGLAYLAGMGWLMKIGVSAAATTGLIVGIFTAFCCIIHLMIPDKLYLNKLTTIFGAIAVTFSQGGENLTAVILTLVLGTVVALFCKEGVNLLPKE